MERNIRKKITRQNLSAKSRQDRFISGYVQIKHSQVYDEAMAYYNELDQRYPGKRDLCKTIEYLRMTGVKSYVEYYKKRTYSGTKREKQSEEKTKIRDNMVLEIPLQKHPNKALVKHQEGYDNDLESILTTPNYQEIMQAITNDPVLFSFYNDQTANNIVDMSEIPQIEATIEIPQIEATIENTGEHMGENSFPDIPDHVYNEIVEELSKDTDLATIFDDMDVDIDYELQQTELEKELISLGF